MESSRHWKDRPCHPDRHPDIHPQVLPPSLTRRLHLEVMVLAGDTPQDIIITHRHTAVDVLTISPTLHQTSPPEARVTSPVAAAMAEEGVEGEVAEAVKFLAEEEAAAAAAAEVECELEASLSPFKDQLDKTTGPMESGAMSMRATRGMLATVVMVDLQGVPLVNRIDPRSSSCSDLDDPRSIIHSTLRLYSLAMAMASSQNGQTWSWASQRSRLAERQLVMECKYTRSLASPFGRHRENTDRCVIA